MRCRHQIIAALDHWRKPIYGAAMSTRDELVREIEDFLDETGMTPTKFGVDATGDRALMITLRGGRDVTLATADKIRTFMVEQRKLLRKRRKGGSKRALEATI